MKNQEPEGKNLLNIDTKKDGLIVNYKPKGKATSKKVKEFKEILKDVNLLYAGVEETGMPTLHHSEIISKQPMDFFVINKKYRFMWRGHGLIMNAKIVEFSDSRQIDESCAQFPFRGKKRMRRYNRITIEASTENLETGLMEPVVLDLVGPAAYFTQHNIDHAQGKRIY